MPQWTSRIEFGNNRIHKYTLFENDRPLAFDSVIAYWANNADFRVFYHELLAESPFSAYFWEHPPLTTSSLDQPYEMVLVDSAALARIAPDASAFFAYFQQDKLITDFPNLSGDTHLIVPALDGQLNYPHLAAFCRTAPLGTLHAFWQRLGEKLPPLMAQQTTWLSTSGLGVYWLHLRLSTRPKYYTYAPYRTQ